MKIIVLAAGKGSRLKIGTKSKFAFSIPFLILNYDKNRDNIKINEEYLIENLFKGLKELKFSCLFVLGYKFLENTPILSYLSHKYGKRIDYIVNPFFEETNTSYSLWLALKSLIDNGYLEDILIFNGDNYLSKKAWEKIKSKLNNTKKSFIVIDNFKELTEESFKIKILKDKNIIEKMGKEISISESEGEFIGVSYIKKDDLITFFKILENIVKENKQNYYDIAFIEFSKKTQLDFLFLNGEKWTEIDFKEDLENLKKIIKEDSN
jgi:choline kinase